MNPFKKMLASLAPPVGAVALAHAVPEWLQPVRGDAPCGISPEYSAAYMVLQARLVPRAQVQYGSFVVEPEAPDWAEVEREARALLQHSRDISVLLWFARARCRLGGAAGLLQGLHSLLAVLQAYPQQVHPQPMQEGEADPAVRANALAALCDPQGLLGDLREVLVSAGTARRLSVRDVERALSVPRHPYALDAALVRRQLADLQARGDAVQAAFHDCAACVQGIAQWCQAHLQEAAPSLQALQRVLGLLQASSEEAPPALPAVTPVAPQVVAAVAPALALTARAQVQHEREQVRALLVQVQQWIEQHEPSSPVAVLLKQATRLWGRRYAEIAGAIPPDLLQAWDRE